MLGQTGPLVADARRQLGGVFFHQVHGFAAGQHAGQAHAQNLDRGHTVVALQPGRTRGPAGSGKRTERHHGSAAVTHVPTVDVAGQHAELRVGLQEDLFDPALVDEVVHIAAAPGGRKGGVDVGHAQAQGTGFLRVNFQLELGRVFEPVGAHTDQTFFLGQCAQQLVARLHQSGMAHVATVLQHQIEASGIAQLGHSGRHHGKHRAVADAGKRRLGFGGHGADLQAGGRALVPRLELDEGQARVLSATGKAETGHREDRLHRVLLVFHKVLFDRVDDLQRALLRGTGRQLDQGEQGALVFVGQETGRNFGKAVAHKSHQHRIARHVDPATAQHVAHHALVALAATVKHAVEPAKEAGVGQRMALGHGLEQGGAQGGRQNHRHQHRQRHGRHDGDRELAVDHAGRATKKRHWHKHRRQHQGHTHQRTGDLAHGFARGFQRRGAVFGHHALHVFYHHNRIVHQQTNGQHHGQHGQGVDRIAKRRQHAKGAQQHYRHGDGGDQRGAEVLQKQVHHKEHQHHGFDQRLDHFFDRDAHKRRGVVGLVGLHPGGVELAQLGQFGIYAAHRVERIGTGGQLDGQAGGGLAVEVGHAAVVLAAQFDAGHVAQAHAGAVGLGAQNDVFKFGGSLQPGLRGDGGVELLPRRRRQAAQLARRHLGVLRADGGAHIGWRELEVVQLARV